MDSINRGVRLPLLPMPCMHACCSRTFLQLNACWHHLRRLGVPPAQRALMMLMEFAAEQRDTQFILLTPLDLISINQAATEVLSPNQQHREDSLRHDWLCECARRLPDKWQADAGIILHSKANSVAGKRTWTLHCIPW